MVRGLMKNGFDGAIKNPLSATDESLLDLVCFGSHEVQTIEILVLERVSLCRSSKHLGRKKPL
jgi:hypothetical protein